MIIRRFLQWAATAPAKQRAEGASALARAYVDGEFADADCPEAAAALTALLDDPAPVVRLALALAMGPSSRTPPSIATALAADRSDIAALVLEYSPVLSAPELVDAVAIGDSVVQGAVARRAGLDVGLSAAIAEVASADACIELCHNETAVIPHTTLARLIERFGGDAKVREALVTRERLPPSLRFDLVAETARSLASFVAARGWLAADRAARVTRDATEQACMSIAAETHRQDGDGGMAKLVRHLRETGCLTPALMLRAALCGNAAFFEAAVSDLAGVPLKRVAGLVRRGQGLGFQALYAKAGLPAALLPAFAAALHLSDDGEAMSGETLHRERIGHALAVCRGPQTGELGTVTVLLRRLDAQAAREEARNYACDVLRNATVCLPRPAATDRYLALASAA